MKSIACVFALSVVGSPAFAETDAQPHTSPNGKVSIINIGDTAQPDHYFQIRSDDGQVLISSNAYQGLTAGSFAMAIRWSQDSHFVAFCVQTSSPYVQDTFIYSTKTNSILMLPTEDDDHQTKPVRWHAANLLIIETRSPIGGKADHDTYSYRRTIRLTDPPIRHETLYTTKPARR